MTKKELKKIYQNKRKTLSPKALEEISENISTILFRNFNLENKFISLFLPIEKEKEINTYIILNKALSIHSKVLIPKINIESNSLKHLLFKKESKLELNSYSIPELTKGKIIPSYQIDFIIVPMFVCNKYGHRVGYGKGYYDKFLANCSPNCVFIGISHFDVFEEIDDINFFDVKIHYLITPNKLYKFPII